MITIDGLVTGIDTTSIVEGLVEIHQNRVDQLRTTQDKYRDQQTAFKGVEARLLTLRAAAGRLGRLQDSVFRSKIATSSDEDSISAAATAKATPGFYTITVDELARAHQVASQSFASSEAEITQGTLTLQKGTGTATTITVDANNNTLQGLVNSINDAEAGISAAIINDGANSKRLLLTSSDTGASNAISITNNLASGSGGAVQPVFDTGNPVQAASDSTIRLGDGAGAITITNSSNTIDSVIDGVTLSLGVANSNKPITISVVNDTEPAEQAILEFVDSYNELMGFIDEQVRFEGTSGQAGALLGNLTTTLVQNEIQSVVGSLVPGVNSSMNRLSSIGVDFTNTGKMTVDGARLADALNGRIEDIGSEDVRRLFALDGKSNNGSVRFVLGSSKTQASTVPYKVDVTQVAEQATISGTSAIASSTVIDSSNNTLSLNIDGKVSGSLTLADGTYTQEELVAELDRVIQADSELKGREVAASLDGGILTLTSGAYGASSRVSMLGGLSVTALGFVGDETDSGQNVAGNFIVNGKVEAARGIGRLLSGESENEFTADLQVLVSLNASQVTSGHEAEITVTRGIGGLMDQGIASMLDPVSGRMKTANDGFDQSIADIEESIKNQTQILEDRQAALIREFVAMESAVAELQNQGNFLSAQLLGVSSIGQ